MLSITTFPQIAIAAPLFRLWSDIGLYDTLVGLVIPYLTFALPLSIYILVSFFKEIPKDLEEAALVDGATHFEAFRKVVVPLAAPGLATTAILWRPALTQPRAAARMKRARLGLQLEVVLERAMVPSRQHEQPLRVRRAARGAPR